MSVACRFAKSNRTAPVADFKDVVTNIDASVQACFESALAQWISAIRFKQQPVTGDAAVK